MGNNGLYVKFDDRCTYCRKLADIFGRRILYVLGIVIFMLGSGLSGQAHSMTSLILSRGLQGVGGGIMMPMAMTLLQPRYLLVYPVKNA